MKPLTEHEKKMILDYAENDGEVTLTLDEIKRLFYENEQLRRENECLEEENYAKKSAALILSAHLHISEQGAEQIVELLIEAVKYELRVSTISTELYRQG